MMNYYAAQGADARIAAGPGAAPLGREEAVRQLIVLGSSITALAVVRSAWRAGLAPVLLDDRGGIATASCYATTEIHRKLSRAGIVERIGALATRAPTALIATSDDWLRFVSAHRRELGAACRRILNPSNEVLALCLDKKRFADWCEASRLPAPRRLRIGCRRGAAPPAVRYPLLVRPAQSAHGSVRLPKAVQVADRRELARRLEEFRRAGVPAIVTESLLERRLAQYSVGVARARGRSLSFVMRKLRPHPGACSTGSCVETVDHPQVEALALRALALLDYEGIAEVEVLRDEKAGENFVIEINARPWLQFALGAAAGRDLLEFLVKEQAGPFSTGQVRPALWLDFHADFYACFGRCTGIVRTGKLTRTEYVRTLLRADTFARWAPGDSGPFLRGCLALILERVRRLAVVRLGRVMALGMRRAVLRWLRTQARGQSSSAS